MSFSLNHFYVSVAISRQVASAALSSGIWWSQLFHDIDVVNILRKNLKESLRFSPFDLENISWQIFFWASFRNFYESRFPKHL